MKSLIKNYIDLLSIEKFEEFAIKNDIKLNPNELEFVFNLIKNNWQDILTNDEKYLKKLKITINNDNFIKIEKLYQFYKKRYKGYLF